MKARSLLGIVLLLSIIAIAAAPALADPIVVFNETFPQANGATPSANWTQFAGGTVNLLVQSNALQAPSGTDNKYIEFNGSLVPALNGSLGQGNWSNVTMISWTQKLSAVGGGNKQPSWQFDGINFGGTSYLGFIARFDAGNLFVWNGRDLAAAVDSNGNSGATNCNLQGSANVEWLFNLTWNSTHYMFYCNNILQLTMAKNLSQSNNYPKFFDWFNPRASSTANMNLDNVTVWWNGTLSAATSNMTISVNNTRTGSLISGFSWNFTNSNASDNNAKSGYCSATSCSITNFTGNLNITVFNISGGYFNPYDSPKLNFFYNQTGTAAQQSYTFQTFVNSLQANITNVVNGSLISSFCLNASNSTSSQSNCTTSGLVSLTGISGSTTLLYYNISNGTYFNVTHSIGVFNATLTNFTNSTYQSLLNITAKQLFTLSAIQTFNATNVLLANQTTNGQLFIKGNDGANNLKVDVPGNYSLNFTCTGVSLQTVNCTATGIYDNLFKVNATSALSGAAVTNFTIRVTNESLGGNVVNASTTNGTVFIPLLQGYYWNLFIDPTGFAFANVTRLANQSLNNYSFSLLPTNSIFLYFFDQTTLNAIFENVTVTFSNGTFSFTNSSNSSTMIASSLNPGTWTITADAANYEPSQYFVTVGNGTSQLLDVYLLNSTLSGETTITIKDADTADVIQNATVTIQVLVGSNWVTLDQQLSDLFGVTFFTLEQGTQYQIIVEADGYSTKSGLFVRTTSSYIVTLSSANTQNFLTYGQEVSYAMLPTAVGNNVTTFSLTTSSPEGTLQWFAVQVLLNGSTSLQNVTGSPSGGTASITLNLSGFEGQYVYVTYYIDTINFDEPLVINRNFLIHGFTEGNYTLSSFMDYYADDNNGFTQTSRGIIATVAAVILGSLLGMIFGTAAAVIGASLVFIIAAFYGWIHWTIIAIVVGGLVGALFLTGKGR